MPIDPDLAVGAELPERTFSWTESDVLLYHLGVGFGARPGDNLDPATLSFTTESDTGAPFQVLPSFALVAPTFHATEPPGLDMPGVDISLSQVVHGSQALELHGPLPTSGTATMRTRISDVWDKGKAAVIVQESSAVGEDGSMLFTTRSSIFVRGEGGFGGDRGPSGGIEVPDRPADLDTTFWTTPQQALLYRLCGDRNPLHSDPTFAERAGFPAPILHGLCSYGIVLRTLVQDLLGADASRVGSFSGRFAGVVFPGEGIRTRAWTESGQVVVEAIITSEREERAGAPVLRDCVLNVSN